MGESVEGRGERSGEGEHRGERVGAERREDTERKGGERRWDTYQTECQDQVQLPDQ